MRDSSRRVNRGCPALLAALIVLSASRVATADDGRTTVPPADAASSPKPRTGNIELMSPLDPPRFVSIDPPAPRQPAPFLLPDLGHPQFDLHLDEIFGWLSPSPQIGGRGASFAAIVRPSMEGNIQSGRLYVGFAFPIAMALPPDGGLVPGESGRLAGLHTIVGNAQAHFRAVFPLPMALEIGFEMGVLAPTATYDRTSRANQSISAAAATLDPTNAIEFQPGRVGLRPAADVRIRRGPLIVQAREGLDIIIDDDGLESARLAGRLLGHVGYMLRPDLEVSVEASQIYFFASDDAATGTDPASRFANAYRVSDDHRAAFNIGPALRYATRSIDVGAAFMTNIGSPFSPAVDDFVGFRISLAAHVGRER